MAEDLVAELAGVAGPRDDDRDPVMGPDPSDQEAEPLELLEARLGRRRPHDLLQRVTARGPLEGHVVELIGGRLDPHLEPLAVGDLAQPDAVVLVAADEAEVVLAEPEHGGVVDHPAGLVAQRRVDDLAHRQLADVAGHDALHERLGVGTQHLPLAQRREVHQRDLLAARPVLGDPALVVEAVGQPVAAVLDEALGQLRGPRVERGLLRQHRRSVGGHAVGDGHREAILRRIHAHVDICHLPGIRWVDVVGTGR